MSAASDKLSELIGHSVGEDFVLGIRHRLAVTWDLHDIEDHDIVATTELIRMRIDKGKHAEPGDVEHWRKQIANMVALIKRQ